MAIYCVQGRLGSELVGVPVEAPFHEGNGYTSSGEAAFLAGVESATEFGRVIVTDVGTGHIELMVDGGRIVEPVELGEAADVVGLAGLATLLREQLRARGEEAP